MTTYYDNCIWCGAELPTPMGFRSTNPFCSERCKREYKDAQSGRDREAERREAERRQRIADEKERERKKDPKQWYGDEWAKHLSEHPEDAFMCDWSKLRSADIRYLLSRQPQLAPKDIDWPARMANSDWVELVLQQPGLADRFDWKKLSSEKTVELLCSKGGDKLIDYCDLSVLTGSQIRDILVENYSQENEDAGLLLDKLDLSRMTANEWAEVLVYDCIHELGIFRRMPEKLWREIDADHWSGILSTGEDQLDDKCECWNEFTGEDWAWTLSSRPELIDKCDTKKLEAKHWLKILSHQPELVDCCNKRNEISPDEWLEILLKHPQLSAKRDIVDSFSGLQWRQLLVKHPQLAEKCDWSKFSGGSWSKLLRERPEFADKCAWDKIEGAGWARLLSVHPEFADKCDWDSLDDDDWDFLLSHNNSLEFRKKREEIDDFLLHAAFKVKAAGSWLKTKGRWNAYEAGLVLDKRPSFVRRIPDDVLAGIGVWEWKLLVEKHPQLVKWIPEAAIPRKDYQKYPHIVCAALINDPKTVSSDEAEVLTRGDWAEVVKVRPEMLGVFLKTKVYEKYPEDAWSRIIANVPDLYDKCPCVDRFTSNDWRHILECQPQFADKCNCWDRFDRVDWLYLLESQPQFADRCRCWKKFDKNDWKSLIKKQPVLKKQYWRYYVGCLGRLFRIFLFLAVAGVLILIAASYFEKQIDKLPPELQMDAQAAADLGHKIREKVGLK